MIIAWHHWAIVGVALVGAELLIPAFVLVWFGLGALVVAGLVAIMPELGLVPELLIWIVSSAAFVLLWFKLFKPHQAKVSAGVAQTQVIGEVGLLIRDVAPFEKGQVRFQTPLIGADVWECIADEAIKTGERVEVVSVEGSLIKVKTTKS